MLDDLDLKVKGQGLSDQVQSRSKVEVMLQVPVGIALSCYSYRNYAQCPALTLLLCSLACCFLTFLLHKYLSFVCIGFSRWIFL